MEGNRLDDLFGGGIYSLPEGDLDFDFDYEATDLLEEALGMQDTPMESLLDKQYGAVAALATQGAIVRPVLTPTEPGGQQTYQQDWHRWDPNNLFPDLDGSNPSSTSVLNSNDFAALQGGSMDTTGPFSQLDYQAHNGDGSSYPVQDYQHQQSPYSVEQQQADFASNRVTSMGSHDSGSSGERGSGDLGNQQGKTEAELRAERTKQKNKRAQKKFRQKQKDKHVELEKSAAELAARLKRTLGELDVLQNQKKVLEIALTRNANPVASAALGSQDAEEELVFVPAKGFERFSSKSGILLEVLFDPPRKLTHEQAIRLSLKDHARIWKEVCRQASELLRGGDEDINSPSGKKLRALLNERHGLLAWTSVNNPVIMHKLMTSKLVDPPVPDNESPGPDFWRLILDALRLSDEQMRNLLKARNIYLTEVGRLLEERRRLQSILRGLDTGFKSSLGDKARTHVLWAEAVRALQENVDAFHICHCVFMVTVFNRATGFSVFQEAMLLVQSFPHAPDVFALLKELAVIAGEPAALILLRQGAETSPSTVLPARPVDAEQEPYISLESKMESAIAAVKLDTFIEKLQ